MKLTKYSVFVKASQGEEEPDYWSLYDALPSEIKRSLQEGSSFEDIIGKWHQGPCPSLEPFIYEDPRLAYGYAAYVSKEPFPLGEPAIARSAEYSERYARNVLKGSFPLGEPAISLDGQKAYLYSRETLKKPFPLGESAIKRNQVLWLAYLRRFPERAFK